MEITVPKDLGFRPIPPAVYKANIGAPDFKVKTSSTHKPMLQVGFTILSEGPDKEFNTVGKKIVDQYVIEENTLWRLNILYRACTGQDIPAGKITVDELISLITSHCANCDVMIRVETEMYEGSERTRVREVQPVR